MHKKGSSNTGRWNLKCLEKSKPKHLRQNGPSGSKAGTNKSSLYRQDNQCYPQKGSRHAIDFQLFAGGNNREIGTTCSDKSLTAATGWCCSSHSAAKTPHITKALLALISDQNSHTDCRWQIRRRKDVRRKIILIREYANTLMRWTHWSQHNLIVQGERPFVNGLKIWQILKSITRCHKGQGTKKKLSVTVYSEEQPNTKEVALTQDVWPLRHFLKFIFEQGLKALEERDPESWEFYSGNPFGVWMARLW